jgi:hypothetical protein
VINGKISATKANQAALRSAMEVAGVEFIDENGGRAGVRKAKRDQTKKRLTGLAATWPSADGGPIRFCVLPICADLQLQEPLGMGLLLLRNEPNFWMVA